MAHTVSDDWFDGRKQNGAHTRTTKRPRHFTDRVALTAFMMKALPNGGHVGGGPGAPEMNFAETREDVASLAAAICDWPARARTKLLFQSNWQDGEGNRGFTFYRFTQSTPAAKATTIIESSDPARLESGWQTVKAHSVEMDRWHRRKDVPLVEPLTVEEETRSRRELDLSRAASRKGALWGALTGFVAALITSAATIYAASLAGVPIVP